MIDEQYLPVVGYEGNYEVSNYGNVRSLKFSPTGKLLKLNKGKRGYLCVRISRENVFENKNVQILVIEAFKGPRPKGLCCLHGDGNKENNHIDNLRWGTYNENIQDSIKHGTRRYVFGNESGKSKLKEIEVKKIKEMLAAGMRESEICKIYGVVSHTINDIKLGKSWKHVAA